MNRHPEYPVNAFLKYARKKGLWGVSRGPDSTVVRGLMITMATVPKFRVPRELAASAKGDKPYAGVRMPYREMVVEFQPDEEEPEEQHGKMTGFVEFAYLREFYGPHEQEPMGMHVVCPLWFPRDRSWGMFPWAAKIIYPDVVQDHHGKDTEVGRALTFMDAAEKDGELPDLNKVLAMVPEEMMPETAQVFEQGWDNEGLSLQQRSGRILTQLRPVCFEIMAMLAMLTCRNVNTVQMPPSRKARKAARERGQLPPYTYHTLDIFLDEVRHQGPAQGGHHEPPRLHRVRGHYKDRATGRFWWHAFKRGNPKRGKVDKTYQLKQQQEGKTDE